MSQTPTPANRLRQISTQVDELAAKESPTIRDCWQGLELMQQYADELGEMAENLPPYDMRITIAREGIGIRFQDIDALANYLLSFGKLENGK